MKPLKTITSVQNEIVKQWTQLLDKKGRTAQGKFIIEGVHLVQEALLNDADIETVAFSASKGIPAELQGLVSEKHEWIEVSDAVIAKCTDTATPQPVFAVIGKPVYRVEHLLDTERSLAVVVDGVQDPGNLGTIIRSADAVGALAVIIGKGTVDLYNPKSVRATMGALFHLPIIEADLERLLPKAVQASVQLVNTSLDASRTCYEVDFRPSTWFVVGNEGKGVSREISRYVDCHIKIPMPGRAESLNVAMATTVLLYEALRQRQFKVNNC